MDRRTFIEARNNRAAHNGSVVVLDVALTRVQENLLLYQSTSRQLRHYHEEHGCVRVL